MCVINEMKRRIEDLEEKNDKLRTALTDWLNLYAPEHCDPDRVHEARVRIGEYGTLGYIAKTLEECKPSNAPR